MVITAVILARSGSKGIPGKNIKLLNGKPLINWTIEAAKKSKLVSKIIVSTDSEKISEIALSAGAQVPFLRPGHLAQDNTSSIDVIFDLLKKINNLDNLLLLQPTSPLRTSSDIDKLLRHALNGKHDSVVSISPNNIYHSIYINNDNIVPIFPDFFTKRRQDTPQSYEINGAMYFATSNFINKNKALISEKSSFFIMDKGKSVDIDDMDDWDYAEYLMSKRLKK